MSHPNNSPSPGRANRAARLAAFAFLATALPAFGPVPPAGAQSASRSTALTAAQKQQIKARRDKLEQDLAALRSNKNMSDAEKQKEFEKLEVAYASDIAAILTPAQRASFAAKLNEDARLRKLREAEFRTVTQQILELSDKLQQSLSSSQKQQIAQAKQDARASADKVNGDKSLSAQQHDQKITEVERQLESRIDGIFTADQKSTFDKIQTLEQRQIQLINGAKPANADSGAPAAP